MEENLGGSRSVGNKEKNFTSALNFYHGGVTGILSPLHKIP
jgi:hypothetical protein